MANYTKQQKKAIDLRDRDILVSASAGTGKTAVLTERIAELVLDESNPVNIDEMVVVTFTRAAAAEMKERIEEKLAARQDGRDDGNIKKQLALLPHARITTLHSLCLDIIRNYFYTIGIDPSFRIGDEQEMQLMKSEVMDELLEQEYAKKRPEFISLAEALAPGKSDDALGETILKLHTSAESHAKPYEWLSRCGGAYLEPAPADFSGAPWFEGSGLLKYTGEVLSGAIESLGMAAGMCKGKDGFDSIYAFLLEEKEKLEAVAESRSYPEYNERLRGLSFARFPQMRRTTDTEMKALKDEIKALRDSEKGDITRLIKNYYYDDTEAICRDIAKCGGTVSAFCGLAAEFRRRFIEKKRLENVMDFNDIEHYALDILENEENGAVRELREQYRYILVDEYQDINEVQETVISKISRQEDGEPNVFMVGDVKQSIYGFRLAKPEIFEKKWETYTDCDSEHQRVMLKRNFRSSPAILGTVDFIFSHIMKKQLGNIEYDETHEFEYDAPDSPEGYGEPVEVIYVSEEGIKETEYDRRKLEATCIAEKIKEITDPERGMTVTDGQTKEKRRARYDDIVILLRSMQGWAEEFTETLMEKQIPVSADEHTGYFSAREIQLALSMLKIIDNPRQDIPLCAVLRSVFGGFDDDDLARIRAYDAKRDMFGAVCAMAESENEDKRVLAEKCKNFLDTLNSLRDDAPYIRVYELLEKVYGVNGFMLNMKAMPQGERRAANLKMLSRMAASFEETDKRSLFDFLEYIEKMDNAKTDFGESVSEESLNGAVRIMSIHKSKGLEFPIVFAAGMGKGHNFTDSKKSVVIHSDAGVGIDCFDVEKRVKYKTLAKKAISRRIIDDSLGEELRVLYVAATRAREKLIFTGTVPSPASLFEKSAAGKYSYSAMVSEKSTYYTWLTPCFMAHPSWPFTDSCGGNLTGCSKEKLPSLKFSIYGLSDAEKEESADILKKEVVKSRLLNVITMEEGEGKEAMDCMDREDAYRYPYANDVGLAQTVSVSELKKRAAELIDSEAVDILWEATEKPAYVPKFAKEDKKAEMNGAKRGTIYHSLMEHMKLSEIKDGDDIKDLIGRLIIKGVLPENTLSDGIISIADIMAFCACPLAGRMKAAQESGLFFAEQPFVMGLSASEINPGTDSEEIILVQGIIDALFEEDGGIVLVDYKTDALSPGEEEKLADRYREQLECYKKAIEKSMGKSVREMYLYSFALNKEIKL